MTINWDFPQCLGIDGNSYVQVKVLYSETVSLVCLSWYRKHITSIYIHMYIMGIYMVYTFFIFIYITEISLELQSEKFLLFVLKGFKTSVCEYPDTNFK